MLYTHTSAVKHVRRVVGLYMREECDCLPYLSRNLVPDLKAIALDGAKEPTTQVSWASVKIEKTYLTERYCQLIQAVFLAAMYSPNSNQRMVKVLDNLGTKVALPLANAITDMQERDRILAENADNERSTSQKYSTTGSEADSNKIGIGRDPELESEEKLLQAHASIKRLENRSTEQIREIEALRAHTTKLEGKIAETKLRIDTEGRGAFEAETLKTLRAQYARDKDYIVELESDLESAKLTIESQRAQLERLKSDTASKQDLRDEIQLIRIERDELASKAKANDNLRKKIEHLQNEEKRNQELRQQLEATNESLQQYDDLQKTCEVLRTAHAESQRTIANQEIEIFHIKETKKRLEQELENINRDLRDSTEQASKHEETIVELQSRLNDIEAEQAGKGLAAGSLGAQIAQKELEDRLQATKILLRWQRGLTKYSKSAMSIKSTSNSGNNDADVTVLQQKLEAAEERNSKTEAHFLEVANENRGLRNLMKAATGDQEIEYRIHNQITGKTLTDWLGSKAPFVKQNEKLIAIRQEAEGYKRRYFDLLAELNEVQKLVSTATGPGYDAHALKKISQEGTEKLHRYSRSLGANLDQQKRFVGQSFGSRENNEIKENFGDELENRSEVGTSGDNCSNVSSPSSTHSVLPPSYKLPNEQRDSLKDEVAKLQGLSSPKPAHFGPRSAQTGIKPRTTAVSSSAFAGIAKIAGSLPSASSSSSSSVKKSPARSSSRFSLLNMFTNGKH